MACNLFADSEQSLFESIKQNIIKSIIFKHLKINFKKKFNFNKQLFKKKLLACFMMTKVASRLENIAFH